MLKIVAYEVLLDVGFLVCHFYDFCEHRAYD